MVTTSLQLNTLYNVKEPERDKDSLECDGVTPIALPKTEMQGVSTRSVQSAINKENRDKRHRMCWHVMRVAYGKEKDVSEYIASKGLEVFCPTRKIRTIIKDQQSIRYNGSSDKLHMIVKEVSLLPNIFFIHSSENIIEQYAFNHEDKLLKYLRFYYNQHHGRNQEPLIIPESQIQDLMKACNSSSGDVLLVPKSVHNFDSGQKVRVTEGPMTGLVGTFARWHGQQRIGIVIDNLGTIATAYVPLSAVEVIGIV